MADKVESSDDEYFDAKEDDPNHLSAVPDIPLSPSISVSAFEGDPPEIQEDRDVQESNNIESTLVF